MLLLVFLLLLPGVDLATYFEEFDQIDRIVDAAVVDDAVVSEISCTCCTSCADVSLVDISDNLYEF